MEKKEFYQEHQKQEPIQQKQQPFFILKGFLFFQVCFFEEDMGNPYWFWSIYSFKSLK